LNCILFKSYSCTPSWICYTQAWDIGTTHKQYLAVFSVGQTLTGTWNGNNISVLPSRNAITGFDVLQSKKLF